MRLVLLFEIIALSAVLTCCQGGALSPDLSLTRRTVSDLDWATAAELFPELSEAAALFKSELPLGSSELEHSPEGTSSDMVLSFYGTSRHRDEPHHPDCAALGDDIAQFAEDYAARPCLARLESIVALRATTAALLPAAKTELAHQMLRAAIPGLPAYYKAALAWACYRLFGRDLEPDSVCGWLGATHFTTLLAQAQAQGYMGVRLAKQLLSDHALIKRQVQLGYFPPGRLLQHVPTALQCLLVLAFKNYAIEERLLAWTLAAVHDRVLVRVFKKLLDRAGKMLVQKPLAYRRLISMSLRRAAGLRVDRSTGSDWQCGPYCCFLKVLITAAPAIVAAEKGVTTGVITGGFPLVALLSHKAAAPVGCRVPITASTLREMDLIATATRFHRSQFNPPDYRARMSVIKALMEKFIRTMTRAADPFLALIAYLTTTGYYRLLDIFLDGSLNGKSLDPAILSSILTTLEKMNRSIDSLALAQILKYVEPDAMPRTYVHAHVCVSHLLLAMRHDVRGTIAPCQPQRGELYPVEFTIPPMMGSFEDADVIRVLRSYLLFQFDIPLDQTRVEEPNDEDLAFSDYSGIFNVLIDRHCQLQGQHSAVHLFIDT